MSSHQNSTGVNIETQEPWDKRTSPNHTPSSSLNDNNGKPLIIQSNSQQPTIVNLPPTTLSNENKEPSPIQAIIPPGPPRPTGPLDFVLGVIIGTLIGIGIWNFIMAYWKHIE